MGDRTTVSGLIGGAIAEEHVGMLAAALADDYCGLDYSSAPLDRDEWEAEIRRAIAGGEPVEYFGDEVNYGELAHVTFAVACLGLRQGHHHDAGNDYGEMAQFQDETGRSASFSTVDGEIALTISEIDNPDTLREARKWAGFQVGALELRP